ncbi:MAG TPA: peptide ABC transporter substrate-binding protein [Tepidisphaeraceae bacterium]|jgi:oligopeptide transport system substrate-binding protein|nr:peptide ABC transporter substrate-binding protein [Tepidisphaeraceae bacterium]
MIRLLSIPVILAGLVAAAVFWSRDVGDRRPADFAFVNRGDNKCLDPNGMSWMQDIRIAYALWEGLYTLDPVTLKPILGCADSAQVDPTHTIWTIHIRPDARWSNGDPVTAGDFLFSWRRFLETPGEYTYLHFYIRGARKYSSDFADYIQAKKRGDTTRPAPDFSAVGEKALDDHTLVVTLADPLPFFGALMAFPPFFPMHEPSMRPFLEPDGLHYNLDFTRPPHLVTNGPYRLEEWTFKRRLRLVASDFYWNRANVKSKVIDQVYAEDGTAAFRTYERGDVDWLAEVDSDLAAQILAHGGRPDLHVFPAFGTYFYSLNCLPTLPDGRANPLADVRVRKALAMSIDREPIVRNVGRLGQPVSFDYIPPHVFDGYSSPPGLPYDVPAARKLLAEAGYPQGQGFPHLSILYNTESLHADVAQIIRRQWMNHLGIEMDLQGVEVKVFAEKLHTQQYAVARASWYGDYDDPTTFTDKYKSDSDDNDSKWINPQYDRLCAEAQKETNEHRRLELLSRAENILLNEAPIIPLFTYVNAYMFRDQVKGLPLAPNAMIMFQSVYKK